VVVVVPGVQGAGAVAELSVEVVAAAGVVAESVVVVVVSVFLLQAPRARLDAAKTAAVAIRLVRQVGVVMERLPRGKIWLKPFNRCGAGRFPKTLETRYRGSVSAAAARPGPPGGPAPGLAGVVPFELAGGETAAV
jgi:hypothetical protein